MFSVRDSYFMQKAMALADLAAAQHEVPIGALIVLEDTIIGEGFNRSISQCDPTAHAEIIALRAAAEKMGNYRLLNTTLYVTLEPCLMCAGAMVHSRIKRLIYGATDPKAGAVASKLSTFDHAFLNHRIAYQGGLFETECSMKLSQFFQMRR